MQVGLHEAHTQRPGFYQNGNALIPMAAQAWLQDAILYTYVLCPHLLHAPRTMVRLQVRDDGLNERHLFLGWKVPGAC